MEAERECRCLGDRVITVGGCGAAVICVTIFIYILCTECGELLSGKRFSLKLKGTVMRSCVKTKILYDT